MPIVSPLQKLLLSQTELAAVHSLRKLDLKIFLRLTRDFSGFSVPSVQFIC